jgi:nickel-type superoxide dismutase maturation protease
MVPTLLPGDRILALRWPRLRPGHLVVVADPRDGRLVVKRVGAVDGGAVTVLGDDPDHSTDSRTFGPVDRRAVRGRVVYRYGPPDRVGAMLDR